MEKDRLNFNNPVAKLGHVTNNSVFKEKWLKASENMSN